MRETELKAVVPDESQCLARLIEAGATKVGDSRLEDRRYDYPDSRLTMKDLVLRLRVTREGEHVSATIDWKGAATFEQGRKGAMIEWETFTRTVDMMAPWAYKVNLFNWGEPLLHSHIFDMIRYARAKGLGTTLSSNLSIRLDDAQIDGLIESGLEFICLSVDGATQDTYARYRRRGNLALVLENMRRLVRRRRELGSRTPVLEWQFIPMKHNEHEVEAARALAGEIGVDLFRCIPVGLPFDAREPEKLEAEWFPITIANGSVGAGQEIASNDASRSACHFLYRYLVVNPDGRTSPCCVVYGQSNDFGDVLAGDVDALWNNANYRSGRALYRKGAHVERPTVCDRCNLFEKRAAYRPPARGEGMH